MRRAGFVLLVERDRVHPFLRAVREARMEVAEVGGWESFTFWRTVEAAGQGRLNGGLGP